MKNHNVGSFREGKSLKSQYYRDVLPILWKIHEGTGLLWKIAECFYRSLSGETSCKKHVDSPESELSQKIFGAKINR